VLIFTRRIDVEHSSSSYSRDAAFLLVCVPVATGYVKLKRDGYRGGDAGDGEDAQPGPTPNGAAMRPSLRSPSALDASRLGFRGGLAAC
jgi:hypothetical protein